MNLREPVIGGLLRSVRHVALSDRLLWPAAQVALAKRPERHRQMPLTTADGFKMELLVGQYPDGAMYLGVFEISTVRLIRRLLRPGDHAVDAGANIGYMSLHMADRVGPTGQVHSFEPIPGNRSRLEKAAADNGYAQIKIHPQALGEKPDQAVMYDYSSTGWHAGSSLHPHYENAVPVPCEIARMDDVVSGPIRCIKVDVEGAEVGAIRGAAQIIRASKPHIIVENNPQTLKGFGYTFADVYDAILSAHDGYDAFLLEPFKPRLTPANAKAGKLPATNVWFKPRDAR